VTPTADGADAPKPSATTAAVVGGLLGGGALLLVFVVARRRWVSGKAKANEAKIVPGVAGEVYLHTSPTSRRKPSSLPFGAAGVSGKSGKSEECDVVADTLLTKPIPVPRQAIRSNSISTAANTTPGSSQPHTPREADGAAPPGRWTRRHKVATVAIDDDGKPASATSGDKDDDDNDDEVEEEVYPYDDDVESCISSASGTSVISLSSMHVDTALRRPHTDVSLLWVRSALEALSEKSGSPVAATSVRPSPAAFPPPLLIAVLENDDPVLERMPSPRLGIPSPFSLEVDGLDEASRSTDVPQTAPSLKITPRSSPLHRGKPSLKWASLGDSCHPVSGKSDASSPASKSRAPLASFWRRLSSGRLPSSSKAAGAPQAAQVDTGTLRTGVALEESDGEDGSVGSTSTAQRRRNRPTKLRKVTALEDDWMPALPADAWSPLRVPAAAKAGKVTWSGERQAQSAARRGMAASLTRKIGVKPRPRGARNNRGVHSMHAAVAAEAVAGTGGSAMSGPLLPDDVVLPVTVAAAAPLSRPQGRRDARRLHPEA